MSILRCRLHHITNTHIASISIFSCRNCLTLMFT